jgi:hypothetical protein
LRCEVSLFLGRDHSCAVLFNRGNALIELGRAGRKAVIGAHLLARRRTASKRGYNDHRNQQRTLPRRLMHHPVSLH